MRSGHPVYSYVIKRRRYYQSRRLIQSSLELVQCRQKVGLHELYCLCTYEDQSQIQRIWRNLQQKKKKALSFLVWTIETKFSLQLKKKKNWWQQTCVKKARFWAVKVDSVCEITIKAFIFLFFVVESSHDNNLEADVHYRLLCDFFMLLLFF